MYFPDIPRQDDTRGTIQLIHVLLLALPSSAAHQPGWQPPDFATRAAAEPALRPLLLPRPRGGEHEWTFALYGVDASHPGVFANITRGMKKFGVGNGFDPIGTSVADFEAASKLGWSMSFSPIEGGNVCFQVRECPNNMTAEQAGRLRILEEANVYSEIQFAEYGYFFSGLQPAKGGGNLAWWHAVFPNTTCNATLCQAEPANPSNKCCADCTLPSTPPPPPCGGSATLHSEAALSLGRGGDLCPEGARCGQAYAHCRYAGSDCSLPPTPEQCCRACQTSANCGSWFLNGHSESLGFTVCYLKVPGVANDTVTKPSANFSAGRPCAAEAGCRPAATCAGGLTNTTEFDIMYARDATPYTDTQGRHLYGFTTLPKSRKDAYEEFRSYYNARVAWITSVGDQPYAPLARVNSITCVSHLEIYAALWNSQGQNREHTVAAGLELQCGHANAAFAMARGGSRRHGKVWTVQPSGWGYGPTTEGCGPLRCTPRGGATAVRACTAAEMKAGATCAGAEASHSYSWCVSAPHDPHGRTTRRLSAGNHVYPASYLGKCTTI
jgi:hypothetical protein